MESNLPVQQPEKKVSLRAAFSLGTGIFSYLVLFFHSLVNLDLIWAVLLAPISAIAAVATGQQARRQIKASNGTLTGIKMAHTGLVLGWIYLIASMVLIVLALLLFGGLVAGLAHLLGSLGLQ